MVKKNLFVVEKWKTIILGHFPLSFGSFTNSSRGEFFLKINQPEKKDYHVSCQSAKNEKDLWRTSHTQCRLNTGA
jgi:hypothetical protein